jgi:hypothetical protein
MPLHIIDPQVRMMAGQLLRQTITSFDVGPQPVAVERYGPTVDAAALDLNPYVWQGVMQKVNALTKTFRALVGRYPVVGENCSQDDLEYAHAVSAVLDAAYGPGSSGFPNQVQ